jgi:VCBS repeat-containing protein
MSTQIIITELAASTGLYAQTAASTPVVNTTTETTILNGGVGTLSVPANGFKVGDSFQATLSGALSAANNNVIRLRTKSGSIVLGDTGPITLPGITDKIFDIHIVFTIRALGAAGTASIATSGQFTYSKDASNVFEGVDFLSINSTTFDTTISNTFDMTVQWETARVINSISTEVFVLHKIY